MGPAALSRLAVTFEKTMIFATPLLVNPMTGMPESLKVSDTLALYFRLRTPRKQLAVQETLVPCARSPVRLHWRATSVLVGVVAVAIEFCQVGVAPAAML